MNLFENASALHASAQWQVCGASGLAHYRFADGYLTLDSDDSALARRFSQVYSEGAVHSVAPGTDGPHVQCSVRQVPGDCLVAIHFDDPEALDAAGFCNILFADRGILAGPADASGWHAVRMQTLDSAALMVLNQHEALADRATVWQSLIANFAINRVMRLQRRSVFMHAASVVVGGSGIILTGPKGAGKTTLSLALAARGHGFLGDEIAALRLADGVLLPFRRATSIRPGIKALQVEKQLGANAYPVERFPDGGERLRVSAGALFPQAAATPAPLRALFFLRRIAARPAVERFSFGLANIGLLQPVAASLWDAAGARLMGVARLLREVPCYHLDSGRPDETADLIEGLAGESG